MQSEGKRPDASACVFDAYGTLFDVHSAIGRRGGALGGQADLVSQTWRTKQLEYAWVGSLSGRYADFWDCTTAALEFALRQHGADLSLRDGLLDAYRSLDAFADVAPAFRRLRGAGMRIAVLSNATDRMLTDALRCARLTDHVDACISIDTARFYKPSPAAYALAVERLHLKVSSIGFISSNAWDVAGARAFGFTPVWVNRGNRPDEYGLHGAVQEARDLTAAVDHLVAVLGADALSSSPRR